LDHITKCTDPVKRNLTLNCHEENKVEPSTVHDHLCMYKVSRPATPNLYAKEPHLVLKFCTTQCNEKISEAAAGKPKLDTPMIMRIVCSSNEDYIRILLSFVMSEGLFLSTQC